MWARHMEVVLNENGFQVESDCSDADRLKAMQEEAKDRSCEEYLAYLFLLMANEERFDEMKKTLAKQWAMGTDSYPKTMQGTVKMMTLFEEKGIVGTGGSGGENGERSRAASPSCRQASPSTGRTPQ